MKLKTVLFASCLLVAAAGCGKKSVPSTVTAHDGSVTFWTPGAGTWQSVPLSNDPGSLKQHIYTVEYGWNNALVFGYIDKPSEPMEYFFTDARNAAVASVNGRLLSSNEITFGPDKCKGLRFTYTGNVDGQNVAGSARMYVIKGQFYQMQAVSGGTKPPETKESQMFFESLKHKSFPAEKRNDDSGSNPEENEE